jgi:hypothetical protein
MFGHCRRLCYEQAIHSQCRFCKLKMLYVFKIFVSLLSGRLYVYLNPTYNIQAFKRLSIDMKLTIYFKLYFRQYWAGFLMVFVAYDQAFRFNDASLSSVSNFFLSLH